MQTVNERSQTRVEKVKQAKETLDEHLQELASELQQGRSERLNRYLEFCAQFHQYSFGNLMLAYSQFRTLTRIAGVKQWNKLGRYVKKGEKGIMILAPITVKKRGRVGKNKQDEDGEENEEPQTITLFKPVYVFDVSQTEGTELPAIIQATGDVSGYFPALEKFVRATGITLEYVGVISGNPGTLGESLGNHIRVCENLEPADKFRTLAHEFAHELLHKTKEREIKTVRETEADATAFVVCRHFGVHCDTADYLLLHDSNAKIFLERLETIRRTAASIIEGIEIVLEIAEERAAEAE